MVGHISVRPPFSETDVIHALNTHAAVLDKGVDGYVIRQKSEQVVMADVELQEAVSQSLYVDWVVDTPVDEPAKSVVEPKPYCIICGVLLNALDDDPNGDKNCVCAKCRAEEKHDYDAEPKAQYDRAGRRIEGT